MKYFHNRAHVEIPEEVSDDSFVECQEKRNKKYQAEKDKFRRFQAIFNDDVKIEAADDADDEHEPDFGMFLI